MGIRIGSWEIQLPRRILTVNRLVRHDGCVRSKIASNRTSRAMEGSKRARMGKG